MRRGKLRRGLEGSREVDAVLVEEMMGGRLEEEEEEEEEVVG